MKPPSVMHAIVLANISSSCPGMVYLAPTTSSRILRHHMAIKLPTRISNNTTHLHQSDLSRPRMRLRMLCLWNYQARRLQQMQSFQGHQNPRSQVIRRCKHPDRSASMGLSSSVIFSAELRYFVDNLATLYRSIFFFNITILTNK